VGAENGRIGLSSMGSGGVGKDVLEDDWEARVMLSIWDCMDALRDGWFKCVGRYSSIR
jgi:hypothetical protein